MSKRGEPTVQNTSPADGATPFYVPPTIKTREDLDGCGCLECRNIETITTRRTVLDALVWSARLFRSKPSIVVFGTCVLLLNRFLEADGAEVLPTPVVGVLEVTAAFAFIVLLRAYVSTIVTGELTNDTVTVREGLRRSLNRVPALIGLIVLLIFTMMAISFLVFGPLLILTVSIVGNPVEAVGFPVVAAVGVTVFVVPFLLLLFKFWFAPEACVIGRYGPIKSLRVSWRITTNYRTKFLLVMLIVAGSVLGLFLPEYTPELSGNLASISPVLHAVSASLGEFLSILWASAYAHIYVQGVVEL